MPIAAADENTEVREELLEVVRRFRDKEIIPTASHYDAQDEYPEPIVERMKELGLFGITVPTEYGGLGLDLLTYVMVVEELSYGWMSVSGFLNTHFMGCFLIKTFGTEEQKQKFLPRMATGEIRAAYSLSEPDAGSDVAAIRTRAVRDGDEYVVNGTKMWLTNGREARLVVTLVRTDPNPDTRHRGLSVLLVEKEPGPRYEGITVGPNIHKLGYRGVETVELVFDNHRVPAANLLGAEEGNGFPQMMAAVELGRINIAARAVGVARRAFEESIRYAQQRETFGRPIAQHQAIQFKLAEMGTKLHAARLVCHDAARRKNRGERCDLQAGMAKYFASEACWEICQEALRIHGGNGYANEYPIERLYRDAPLMIVGEGTNEIQKMVIGRRLLEEYAID
ncbi:MAG: acyl-CoA dehydrogenase family protein [Acidimicrobiales bacterium]|nr:acyl-CoA dehydrogenase family protein [Acidimicrobiales bacterium]